jgi:hypothetical protein
MIFSAFGFFAAWNGHTDESRDLAQDIVGALADCCISQKAAAITMKLTHEQQLSRQLAGTEPLNAFRLAFLPVGFHVAFLRRRAARIGAAVISPEDLALLRGAAVMGPRRLAKLVSANFEEESRIQ